MTNEIIKSLEDNRTNEQIKKDNREIFALDYINERLEQEALNVNRERYINNLERIAKLLSDMEKESNPSISCFVEEDGKLFVPNKDGKLEEFVEMLEEFEGNEDDIKDLPF